MQIQSVLVAAAAMASSAAAAGYYTHHYAEYNHTAVTEGEHNGTWWATRVHPHGFETVCPEPTTLYFNNKTYEIPGPTTFTVGGCPCTEVYHTDSGKPTGGANPNPGPGPAPPVETGKGGDGADNNTPSAPGYGTYQLYPGGNGKPAESGAPGPGASGAPNPVSPPAQTGAAGYGTYQLYPGGNGKPAESGAPGTAGGGGDAPSQVGVPGGKPSHVVVAGADRQTTALAGALALVGAVAVFVL
ncbi:hypothetical protein C8034_v009430 [Colletotrichum sidae]|uniref:Cell wall protein SED1 n=1 Tax=Colletotrichum sidae TaxID=1347389 RepID=A0A4R8T1S1_9PEZI|nr:hypothetical protein C8034_v009430 [Colletotrichum sidae]